MYEYLGHRKIYHWLVIFLRFLASKVYAHMKIIYIETDPMAALVSYVADDDTILCVLSLQ